MKRHGLTGTLRNKATDKQMRWDLSHTQLTDKEDEMRGRARKITTMLLSSALIVTTVCGGIVLKKSNADNTASVIPGEYLKEYSGNITYGTNLYVWSGDKAFDPKNYHPDGNLGENESVTYEEGQLDLTPGATSDVIYRITDEKGESRLRLYTFTAVSDKSSSTVRSGKQDEVIYGLEKSPSFGGQVPADYTDSGISHENERELSITRGDEYYPQLSFQNYDSDEYVMSISDGEVDTTKPGTYEITYSVSPVSDARMYWHEKYTVNVTEKPAESMGMKVVADDNIIHATVTDENGNDTEVFKGCDYNLNAGVKTITVQNRREHAAEADITVKRNGRTIENSEVIRDTERKGDDLTITLRNDYDYRGVEITLGNGKLQKELLSRPDNAVNGGWESHANSGIITDKKSDTTVKTMASNISDLISDTLGIKTVNAASNIKQGTVLKAVSGMAVSHTCEEYHNGAPTGVSVFDGVQVKFSKNKLVSLIDDIVSSEGLGIVSTGDVPTSMYLNCVDHGDAGYYMSQLTKSMLSYANAYLRNDNNTYYVEIVGEYHAAGRQKLAGAIKIQVEKKPAYIQIVKKTDAGGSPGVVAGAVYGVFKTESGAKSGKSPLFKMTLDKDGKATTSEAQALKLKTDTKYYIRELVNPKGTYLNKKVYTIKTTKDGTSKNKAVRLSTVNKPWRTRISVHKKETGTDKDLSGARFTVSRWNGSKYVTATSVGNNGVITTDSKGKAATGWLYYTKNNQGKWRIEETEAPKGHKNNHARKDIQINKDNAKDSEEAPLEWTVDNPLTTEYGYISVQKVVSDADGNDVSADYDMTATFTVYSDSNLKKKVTTITTKGTTGYGKSSAIPTGTYYVKETSWNAGYEPADKNAVKTVNVTKNATTAIEAKPGVNARKVGNQIPWYAGLAARKLDAVTGKPLQGAEFTFYEWNGRRYMPIKTRKTGSDGYARIEIEEHLIRWTKTNRGMFAVAETKAPDGYTIDDTTMKYLVINEQNRNSMAEFTSFTDTGMGYLDITKIIEDGLGNRDTTLDFSSKLLGITYGLYTDKNCTRPVSGLDNIVLDRDGHFKSGPLVPGTYYLRENTLNSEIFANRPGLSMEVTIYPGKTTYLNGEKGLSYDNRTWDNTIW